MARCGEGERMSSPVGAIGGRPGTGGAGTGSTAAPEGMEMPEALAVLTAAEAACTQPSNNTFTCAVTD